MTVIALLLLVVAIALIVAALVGVSDEVTVEFFDVSIATNTAEVFIAGIVTGMVALLALVLLRASMRRSRLRREEVRELRRRAQASRAVTDDETVADRYGDTDDGTGSDTRDYPREERRT